MDFDFSEKLELLLKGSGKTKKSLYDYLGMTYQGFDSMMKNNSYSAVRIAQIAKFFNVPVSYFYENTEVAYSNKSIDGGAFGDQVISELKSMIRDGFDKRSEELLREKQSIIEDLKSIIAFQRELLGKPSDVTADDRHEDPKIIVHPAFARKSEKEVNDYQIA